MNQGLSYLVALDGNWAERGVFVEICVVLLDKVVPKELSEPLVRLLERRSRRCGGNIGLWLASAPELVDQIPKSCPAAA